MELLRPATLVKAGLWSAGIGWAPVVVVGLMDPTTHPTGLAVLAWLGTMLGLGLIAAGGAMALARRIERQRRRRAGRAQRRIRAGLMDPPHPASGRGRLRLANPSQPSPPNGGRRKGEG